MSLSFPPLYRLPAYFIGTSLVGIGLYTLRSPRDYYPIFGLPAPSDLSTSSSGDKGNAATPNTNISASSAFVYVKASRDIVCGAVMVAFQATGNESALNIFVGTMFIAAVVDGWVVWNLGGEKFRSKAWGHWIGGALGLPWVAWRLQNL